MPTATRAPRSSSRNSETQPKNFYEFFAGIGLVREGLLGSGWNCVYANDIDQKKQEQYLARFGGEHFHLADVRETKKILAEMPEEAVLATASFPCIDLSLAGHWRGLSGGEHSSTFFAFADLVEEMRNRRPKLILLENVAGLLTSHDGKDFEAIAKSLAKLGYFVDSFVIDAKHFVPQSRVRVFIVGVHESVIGKCDVVRSNGSALDPWTASVRRREVRPSRLVRLMETIELRTGWMATRIQEPPTVRSHLREFIDVDDDQDWWGKEQVQKHFEMMSDLHKPQVMELMRDKASVHVGTIFRRKRHDKTRAEIRFDGMAGCLRVPRGGSARQIVIVIDRGELRIRWMSPREYARLQGVPDFPLVGKANQQMAGFGDAVCVPVIRWIDEKVLTPLYDAVSG